MCEHVHVGRCPRARAQQVLCSSATSQGACGGNWVLVLAQHLIHWATSMGPGKAAFWRPPVKDQEVAYKRLYSIATMQVTITNPVNEKAVPCQSVWSRVVSYPRFCLHWGPALQVCTSMPTLIHILSFGFGHLFQDRVSLYIITEETVWMTGTWVARRECWMPWDCSYKPPCAC